MSRVRVAARALALIAGVTLSLLLTPTGALACHGISYEDAPAPPPDHYCGPALPLTGTAGVAAVVAVAVATAAVAQFVRGAMSTPQLMTVLDAMTSAPAATAPHATVLTGGARVPILPTVAASVPFAGRVLLVGEGNFSFTAANLRLGRNVAGNITATAYSPDGGYPPEVVANAEALRRVGVDIRLQVDARGLTGAFGGSLPFDSILFQFPHPGGRRAAQSRGRQLLADFFAGAAERLAPGGRVAITLRGQHYVSQWHPIDGAARAGLRLVSVMEFHPEHFPGYTHVTTSAGARPPDVSNALTFVFERG